MSKLSLADLDSVIDGMSNPNDVLVIANLDSFDLSSTVLRIDGKAYKGARIGSGNLYLLKETGLQ